MSDGRDTRIGYMVSLTFYSTMAREMRMRKTTIPQCKAQQRHHILCAKPSGARVCECVCGDTNANANATDTLQQIGFFLKNT